MVSAAPPTPNGDLHVGHLSGPYLAGDIHTRYLRCAGWTPATSSAPTTTRAIPRPTASAWVWVPRRRADKLAGEIKATLEAAGIDLAELVRPNASPHHVQMTQEFFRRLYDGGHLEARETPSPWCETCERYLYEAYIRGRCPHCGSSSGGNLCEDCGRPNDCVGPAGRRVHAVRQPAGPAQFHAPVLPSLPLGGGAEGVSTSRWGWTQPAVALRAGDRRGPAGHDGDPRLGLGHPGAGGGLRGPADLRLVRDGAPLLLLRRSTWADWEAYWKSRRTARSCTASASTTASTTPSSCRRCGWRTTAALQAAGGVHHERVLPAGRPEVLDQPPPRHLGAGAAGRRAGGRDAVLPAPGPAPEVEGTNFTARRVRGHLRPRAGRRLAVVADGGGREGPAGLRRQGAVDGGLDGVEHRRFFHRLEALTAEIATAYEARDVLAPAGVAGALRAGAGGAALRHGRGELERVPARSEERRTAMALELLAAKTPGRGGLAHDAGVRRQLWRGLGYESSGGRGALGGDPLLGARRPADRRTSGSAISPASVNRWQTRKQPAA